jgi:peptidoglycan/LPS O-acetylase OafA/YrhL
VALFICLFHTQGILANETGYKYFRSAHLAVDCFFVLSGFLLARSFYLKSLYTENPTGLIDFFISRIKRLYPEYLFCMISLFILMRCLKVDMGSAKAFFLNFIMVTDVSGIQTMLLGAWYVVVLFWVSCFLYALMYFFKEKALQLYIPLLSFSCLFFLTSNAGAVSGYSVPTVLGFLSQGVVRGFLGLSVGIFAYMIADYINKNDWNCINKKKIHCILIFLELLSIAGLLMLLCSSKKGSFHDFNIYFAFTFIIILLFYKKEFFLRFLSNPVLAKIGDISYILYLSHISLMFCLKKYSVFLDMNVVLIFVLSIIISVVFAVILYFSCRLLRSFIIKQIIVK